MKLPEELLQRLNEFTSGGFLIFCAQDHGVDTYMYADNELVKSALNSHALQLLATQHEIESKMVFNGVVEGIEAEMKAARPKRRKKGGGDNPPA